MELFNLEISKWSINIESYFGDVYLNHRTWMIAIVAIVVLRLAKRIREGW